MKILHLTSLFGLLACGMLLLPVGRVAADESAVFEISEGAYSLPLPKGWEKKPPRNNLIEHEFAITAVEGDPAPGRATVTLATGGVEANITRWFGQFSQPDGSATKDKSKVEEKKVADATVHVVDITGTFDDRPPFGGNGVKRENYRMLGAIIVTPKAGTYYVKLTGPAKTVGGQQKAFAEMIDGLKKK